MPGPNEPIDVLRSFRRLIGTDEHNLALFDATLQSLSDRLQGTQPVGEVLRSEDGVARVAMLDGSLQPGAKVFVAQHGAEATADRRAIKMLVAAGFIPEAKANEALNIAHGFAPGPLEKVSASAGEQQLQRWSEGGPRTNGGMRLDPAGEWVRYEDVAGPGQRP